MRKAPTAEQKQKAAERRERFRQLVRDVAAMSEAERIALSHKVLSLMTCEGHSMSFHNTLLIASQLPTATIVGGFRQWLKQGRCVRKGEHGLMLWFPKHTSNGKADESSADEPADKTEIRFLVGTVFDISQTAEVNGQAGAVAESEAAHA